MTTIRTMLIVIACVVAMSLSAWALPQAPVLTDAPAPVLTDAQKLQVTQAENQVLQAALQQAQAKVAFDAATAAIEHAQAALADRLKGLAHDGYTLDPQTLTYMQQPSAAEKKETTPKEHRSGVS